MRTVFSVLGVFALAFCIYPTDTIEMATESPINFLDLPAELRLDIVEQLDFNDLIRFSKALPENRILIESVFRKMLRNVTFYIKHYEKIRQIRFVNTTGMVDRHPNTLAIITCEDTEEHQEYFEEILEFFQYFGHCITKLGIRYEDSMVNGKFGIAIRKQIRKYVAESVDKFTFIYPSHLNANRVPLADLIDPFPNAKIVSVEGTFTAETLLEKFPTVRSLDLHLVNMIEGFCHFPHLQRLTIPAWNNSQTDLLKKALQLNPQINHLSISFTLQWEIFETLNQIQPDLESLEIINSIIRIYDESTVPIRFANVKVLKWSTWNTDVDQVPLEFENLEEIDFDRSELTNYWIRTMMQNKKLRKVTAHNALQRDHLQQIANGLPNLEEFTMVYYDISVRDIVDFLQLANRLKKATFSYLGEEECNEAAEQLKDEWKNTVNDYRCCFVRNEF